MNAARLKITLMSSVTCSLTGQFVFSIFKVHKIKLFSQLSRANLTDFTLNDHNDKGESYRAVFYIYIAIVLLQTFLLSFQSHLYCYTTGLFRLSSCLAEICHIYVGIRYRHSVKGCWAMNQMSHGVNMCCDSGSLTNYLYVAFCNNKKKTTPRNNRLANVCTISNSAIGDT